MIIIILTVICFIIPLLNWKSINNWILNTSNHIINKSTEESQPGFFNGVKRFLFKLGSLFLKQAISISSKRLASALSLVVLLYLLLLLPLITFTVLPFYIAYFIIKSISPNARKIDDAFEQGKEFGRKTNEELKD